MFLRSTFMAGLFFSLIACNGGSKSPVAGTPEEDWSAKYPGLKTAVTASLTETRSCKTNSKLASKDRDGKDRFESAENTFEQEVEILIHEDGVREISGHNSFQDLICYSVEKDCIHGDTYQRYGQVQTRSVRQDKITGNRLEEHYDFKNIETLYSTDYEAEKDSLQKAVTVQYSGVDVYRLSGAQSFRISSTRDGKTIQYNEAVIVTRTRTEKGILEVAKVVKPFALPSGNVVLEGTSTCEIITSKNKM